MHIHRPSKRTVHVAQLKGHVHAVIVMKICVVKMIQIISVVVILLMIHLSLILSSRYHLFRNISNALIILLILSLVKKISVYLP